jgi:hypothetical protein
MGWTRNLLLDSFLGGNKVATIERRTFPSSKGGYCVVYEQERSRESLRLLPCNVYLKII